MTAKKSGKAYKFARLFQGPYVVQKLFNNGVQVKKMGQLRPLQVPLNKARKCPKELVKEALETIGVKDLQEVRDSEDLQGDSSYEV